ncbi:MAG: TldD/PmbA family protein [Fibrobacterota bacterium]
MNSEKLCTKILDKIKPLCSQADIYYTESEETTVSFKSNKLHSSETVYSRGMGLRAVIEGKVGFSSTNDPERTDELINNTIESSVFGQESRLHDFEKKEFEKTEGVYDEKTAATSAQDFLNNGEQLISKLNDFDPSLSNDIAFSKTVVNQKYMNTAGTTGNIRKSVYSESVESLKVKEDGLLWAADGNTTIGYSPSIAPLSNKIAGLIKNAEHSVSPSGNEKILFMPEAVPSLLGALKLGMNGKILQKGSSPLKGMENKKLFDKNLSIIDNPSVPGMIASRNFDGDGIPCSPIPLVEDGVFKNFIFDSQTAGLLGRKSNGRAGRSYASLPAPSYSNLLIRAGDKTINEIMACDDDLIVVYSVLGSGQSNMLAGDFSLNLHLAFLSEKGEIKGRIKNAMVSGNVYEVLKNIPEISSDIKNFGSAEIPAFLLEGINISF